MDAGAGLCASTCPGRGEAARAAWADPVSPDMLEPGPATQAGVRRSARPGGLGILSRTFKRILFIYSFGDFVFVHSLLILCNYAFTKLSYEYICKFPVSIVANP